MADLADLHVTSNGTQPAKLAECVATFQHWLHLPDPRIVTATVAAVAANLLPGDPLWLLIVGPPSSAKTECLSALIGLPYVHPAAKVTETSLLSGTPPKERIKGAKGGLLRHVGDFGILLCKDFTSVLAQHGDARAEALAALREVYDGRWDRPVGTAGGIVLSWTGKCGLVGGCTPSIDRHHAVMGTLGERFLFYRTSVDEPAAQARKRLSARRHEPEMRHELAAAMAAVLDQISDAGDSPSVAPVPEPDPAEDDWLVDLAVFIARARTPVERDYRDREVVVMPESEGPARIGAQLGAMRDGLVATGASLDDRHAILHKLAWDAVPAMRRKVLAAVAERDWVMRADLMTATDIPKTPIERELEDVVLIGLVDREKSYDRDNAPWRYRLSPAGHDLWPRCSPGMSGGVGTSLFSESESSGGDFLGEQVKETPPR